MTTTDQRGVNDAREKKDAQRVLCSSELENLSPKQVREEFRRNSMQIASTSGLCAGYLQMNVAFMPSAFADDFERFCRENPASLPFVYRSKAGQVTAPELVEDLDISLRVVYFNHMECATQAIFHVLGKKRSHARRSRSSALETKGSIQYLADLGTYSIFEKKRFIGNKPDLLNYSQWKDMVAFYFGCSFSFEGIAAKAGMPFRTVVERIPTLAFETNVSLVSVGPFKGSMLTTMRPCKKSTLERLVQEIAPHETAHGAPIHIGDPAIIGIKDINKPDYGNEITFEKDEVAVFWACGTSATQSLVNAAPNHWITHYTGSVYHHLVTDVKAEDYLVTHKPSFADLKPKVVTVYEEPDFMSLLSDKVLKKITEIGNSCSNTSDGRSLHEYSLARTALVLSHSYGVAIETTRGVSEGEIGAHDHAFALAKALLEEGKKVILFTKDEGMVSTVREETRKAFPTELLHDLQVLGISEVNMQDKGQLGDDVMAMNEVSRSKLIIIVSQNVDSLDVVEQLARSTAVKGTALDVSPWGYDVTVKALSYLRGCPIHSRYRHRGVGTLWKKAARRANRELATR